jgi:chaperonin GroES
MDLQTKLELETILNSVNLAEELSEQDLTTIAAYCSDSFDADMNSRLDWETRMSDALKLALQVKEEKNFPWVGCSNVKFPLITIAAIQYHSRAYPALIDAPNLVKVQTFGGDPQGQLAKAASMVSQHMSWQILEEDKQWEEETDRALLCQPIMGCVFKKSLFDPVKKHNVSETLLPSEFVVNYWTKHLDTAPTMTHIQFHFPNKFHENVKRGLWIETDTENTFTPDQNSPLMQVRDEAQGTSNAQNSPNQPIKVLEQCCYLDLDGDGYAEPYCVTFRKDTQAILRIKARFTSLDVEQNPKNEIVKIVPENPYTKIPFIPSPDGGFYDLGFGMLLGPINASIDSAINQLIDAGTMSNAGGGFLGRGVKVKGGNYSFTPNEWKRVDSTGDDLRANIFPLPVREPSEVLFKLMTLLIDYGQQIAGATEAVSGENPGQNMKNGTMQSMLEQGLKIFSGIYKRTWRALRDEYRKLFKLNKLFLNDSTSFNSMVDGQEKEILISAYNLPESSIRPAADPNYMSQRQRAEQATMVWQASQAPGKSALYNQLEVENYYLETLQIPGREKLLVKELPQAAPPYQVEIQKMKSQDKQAEIALEVQTAQADHQLQIMELMNEADLAQAKIIELQAKAILAIKMAGTAQSDANLAEINAQIGLAKTSHERIKSGIDHIIKIKELNLKEKEINKKETSK